MRKKILAVIGLVAVLGFQFAFLWKASQNPEAQKRTLSFIQDAPAEFFYPIAIGFLLLTIGSFIWILLNHKNWAWTTTQDSVRSAKKVASSLWRVDGPVLNKGDVAVMRFRHLSFSRWTFILPVRPDHPDIDQFRHLKDGDTVEFEALSEGMECALHHELCGFIRIKSVS